MVSFRFEYYENVITKHDLKNVTWTQAAKSCFNNNLDNNDVTIASAKMLDNDTIEIIKRKDQNKGWLYKLGFD